MGRRSDDWGRAPAARRLRLSPRQAAILAAARRAVGAGRRSASLAARRSSVVEQKIAQDNSTSLTSATGWTFLSAPSDSIFPTDRPMRAWGLRLISKCRGRLSLSPTTQTKRLRERFKQPDQRHLDDLLWVVPKSVT